MSTSAAFEIDFPDVGFRKSDQDFYQQMVNKDLNTPFSGLTRAHVFIYAMALGFKKGKPDPYIENERVPNMPPSAFTSEMRWLMRSLAITEKENLESIMNHKTVIEIAEGYANAGIDTMRDLWNQSILEIDDRSAAFESNLRKYLEKL